MKRKWLKNRLHLFINDQTSHAKKQTMDCLKRLIADALLVCTTPAQAEFSATTMLASD